METHDANKDRLHIFVNRKKFEEGDGVRAEMTGEQIAALVGVPADNAVVREESPENERLESTKKFISRTANTFS